MSERKPADLFPGIQDMTKTAVLVVPLDLGTATAVATSWAKLPDNKQLLVVIERTRY